ncbi:type II toxin-antitoxin system VapC family toxin [Patescibacteria group bacterium]|nr:type II toxin-antitoxin system VapC family toxin [Patescibacteria group bacterium]MBU4338212.1 type II toxin-antitoxin system VapC family toxin [Patescibacteria group bacterium]
MILIEETKYCLDANFIINLLKGKSNAVLLYNEIKNAPLTITSVALFEILRGKEQNQNKIQEFDKLLKTLEVLPFSEKEAKEASRTEKAIHQKGQTISSPDLFIGVTAKNNKTTLITDDLNFNSMIESGLQIRNY